MADRRIANDVLTLGEKVHITAPMPSEAADPAEQHFCVKKDHGTVVFYVEPVDWPTRLANALRVSSIIYHGAQTIVRNDHRVATRFHASFPTATYSDLVAYYTKCFGKPTSRSEKGQSRCSTSRANAIR